jgi:hypothetical protein
MRFKIADRRLQIVDFRLSIARFEPGAEAVGLKPSSAIPICNPNLQSAI